MTNIITMIIIDQHTHGLPCWRTPKTSSWSSRACAQGGIQGAAARTAWTTNSTKNTRPSLTRTRHINGIVKDTFLVVIWIPITRMVMVIATRVDVLVIPLAELSTFYVIISLCYCINTIIIPLTEFSIFANIAFSCPCLLVAFSFFSTLTF